MKICLFHKFLFYNLYFESYTLNASDICYSTKHLYIDYDLLSQQHFYSHPLVVYTRYCPDDEYIFDFNPTNSSIAAQAVSFFI